MEQKEIDRILGLMRNRDHLGLLKVEEQLMVLRSLADEVPGLLAKVIENKMGVVDPELHKANAAAVDAMEERDALLLQKDEADGRYDRAFDAAQKYRAALEKIDALRKRLPDPDFAEQKNTAAGIAEIIQTAFAEKPVDGLQIGESRKLPYPKPISNDDAIKRNDEAKKCRTCGDNILGGGATPLGTFWMCVNGHKT